MKNISYQVAQECLSVVLRKAEVPLETRDARVSLDRVLTPLLSVPASIRLLQRGLDVRERYRFGWYDSLIVAAALKAGCSRLLTEDLRAGQRIDTLTVVKPFSC